MKKQRTELKKWQLITLGGALTVCAIIITIGAIREKDNEHANQTDTPAQSSAAPATSRPVTVETETAVSGSDEVLTIDNNADLASLLTGSDSDSGAIEAFASKYEGRTLEFNANIAHMNKHGDYKTRYDFLILAGDYSRSTSTGPNFQFRDVNTFDLNLTGPNVPDSISTGDNLHIIAVLTSYEETSSLLLLNPVSTQIR